MWRRLFAKRSGIRPDYAEAHNNLGLVLIQSGNDDEGIAALREAVRLAPTYVDARTNLGAALTPTDVDGGDPGAGGSGPAGARIGEGPLQSCGGLRCESHARTRQANRAASRR